MHHRHPAGEPGVDPFQRLRSQGNFGNEEDGLAALAHNLVNGPQVDLGLAAARDAVEQETARLELGVIQDLLYPGQGFGLVGRESKLFPARGRLGPDDCRRVGPDPFHGHQSLAE